ncbi:hypothetical protein TNCV_4027841, partial [Trichonephila clavipes]
GTRKTVPSLSERTSQASWRGLQRASWSMPNVMEMASEGGGCPGSNVSGQRRQGLMMRETVPKETGSGRMRKGFQRRGCS